MGLNLYQNAAIYSDMLQHVRYPDNLFTGSPATLQALRDAIQRVTGRP
jgi:hypothetical protein